MHIHRDIVIGAVGIILLLKFCSQETVSAEQMEDVGSGLTYVKLLKLKHAEQLKAAKSILKIEDYHKRHKMLTVIYDKIFEVFSKAKVVIEASGYIHGDDFPSNMTVKEALSSTVENALFFGNILLHVPDISHNILKKNKDWLLMLQWSWQICQELPFLDNSMMTVLNLAAQELGFVEKDPNYVNPYKTVNKRKEHIPYLNKSQPMAKRKSKSARGPRMSSANNGEL